MNIITILYYVINMLNTFIIYLYQIAIIIINERIQII